jgi:small-conductance mechanosensitive channel
VYAQAEQLVHKKQQRITKLEQQLAVALQRAEKIRKRLAQAHKWTLKAEQNLEHAKDNAYGEFVVDRIELMLETELNHS